MKSPHQLERQFLIEILNQLKIYVNAVIGLSQEMLENEDDPLNELQENDLRLLNNSARHLLDITDDLLKLDIDDLVSFVVDENLRSIVRNLSLRCDFSPQLRHNLGAPVNSIIGFSHGILEGVDGPISETQKSSLTHIKEYGERSLQILNQIFDSWYIEDIIDDTTLHLEKINLKEMLESFLSYVKRYGRVEIVENLPDSLPPISTDVIKLRSVLNYTSIALSETFTKGRIILNAYLKDDEVTISIQNDEFFLADFTFKKFEQMRSITTLIYTLPPVREFNETIDLCISRLLVETLGGKMYLEKTGTGSIATFTLPIRSWPIS
jgi:signal transduction histidine kinase